MKDKLILKDYNDKVYKVSVSASLVKEDIKKFEGIKEIHVPNGVVRIEEEALKRKWTLKTVEIEDSITYIGHRNFYDAKDLEEVYLSNNITYIEETNFLFCKKLKYNEYENGLYLGSKTNPYILLIDIIDKDVTSFNIHPNCRIIHASFMGLQKLKRVVLPKSVKQVALRSFNVSNGLEYIEVEEGNNCFTSVDGVLYSKDLSTLIAIPYQKETVTILNSVHKIRGSFSRYPHLRYNVENNIYYLPSESNPYYLCIYGDNNLEEIIIKEGCEIIGPCAFAKCKTKSIKLPHSIKVISHASFLNSEFNNVELYEGLLVIESYAFYQAGRTNNITLPLSLEEIGDYAFYADYWSKTIYSYAGDESKYNQIKKGINIFRIEKMAFIGR